MAIKIVFRIDKEKERAYLAKKSMILRILFLVLMMAIPFASKDTKVIYPECEYNGIKLYGKVKFVTAFPDIKIQYVEHFPDIRVKFVEHFPDECGKWQVVEHFPDFTVQVVDHFPDIKVKVVDHFPGEP